MQFFGTSDKGKKRSINQDGFLCRALWDDSAILAVVCDGMGGHKAGEIASRMALDIFTEEVLKCENPVELPKNIHKDIIRYALVNAAMITNGKIYQTALDSHDFDGMGTTLVAALVYDNMLYVINIGDSRLYMVTAGEAFQVTHDHSFVQYLIDSGKLSEEEARYYPRKNVITRAIGIEDTIEVDFFTVSLKNLHNGYILLCSDGLSNYVTNGKMAEILSGDTSLKEKGEEFIAFANEQGGSDNITVVLIEV